MFKNHNMNVVHLGLYVSGHRSAYVSKTTIK